MSAHWTPSAGWKEKFRGALSAAFNDPALELLTADYFEPRRLFSFVSPPSLQKTHEFRVYELIRNAEMEDWLIDLVAAANERRPKNADLAVIAEERGLMLSGPRIDNPTGTPLEALIQQNAKFFNPTLLLERLAILQGQICFIDVPGGGGTGFLVGSDLVLTNQHVIDPLTRGAVSPRDVKFRFDHKLSIEGTALGEKRQTIVDLRAEWLVDSRPPSATDWDVALGDAGPEELDYALVRLHEAVGDYPIGGPTADSDAERRGWITFPEEPPRPTKGNQIFMFQHPDREPLQGAVGAVTEFNKAGTRMRHTANSKSGSSGSPCFNADFQVVALHHAHDPAYPPQWNQAVPIGLIQNVWSMP